MNRLNLSPMGFALAEILVASAIVIVALFMTISAMGHYFSQSVRLDHADEAMASVGMLLTPVLQAPRYEIQRLCDDKSAWTPRTSDCESSLQTSASASRPVDRSPSMTAVRNLLGRNLSGVTGEFMQGLACLDIVACRYALSDAMIELEFIYYYKDSNPQNLPHRRSIKIHVGSRG